MYMCEMLYQCSQQIVLEILKFDWEMLYGIGHFCTDIGQFFRILSVEGLLL